MIRKVEELPAEFQPPTFAEPPVLRYRSVHADDSRPVEHVAPGISIAVNGDVLRAGVGHARAVRERVQVEPVVRVLLAPGQFRLDPGRIGVAGCVVVLPVAGTAENADRET